MLESACFQPASVRATSRALGLNTESAARFIKGVEPGNTAAALERAAQLIDMLGAGDVVRGAVDVSAAIPRERTKVVSVPFVNSLLLGLELTARKMAMLLKGVHPQHRAGREDAHLHRPAAQAGHPRLRHRRGGRAHVRLRQHPHDPHAGRPAGGQPGRSGGAHRPGEGTAVRLGFEAMTYSFMGPRELDALALEEDDPLRSCVKLKTRSERTRA